MHGAGSRATVRTLRRMSALIVPSRSAVAACALSPAELRAAELDGEVTRVGDAFVPIDTPVGAADRAASIAELSLDRRLFAQRRSAAWVHGWCAEPSTPSLAASIGSRVPSGTRIRTGARELIIDEHELQRIGGVRVTTPVRTLLDLARADERECPLRDLTRMIDQSGLTARDVLHALSRARRAPFAARARTRLLAVADAVDVVDSVDASHGVQNAVEVRDVAHLEDELRDRQAVA